MATLNSTTHFVYRIVCFVTGKCYVGQALPTTNRRSAHFSKLKRGTHHNTKLQRAYNKHGVDKFFYEKLESGISTEDIDAREIWWIAHFDSYRNGYNETPGGGCGGLNGKPCLWEGIVYKSVAECARALGIPLQTMHRRLQLGHSSKSTIHPDGRKPCVWNGINYPSRRAAAKANGVSEGVMGGYLKRGYTCNNDVQIVIKPCTWNGVLYPSQRDAAKANGITESGFTFYIKKGYSRDEDIPKAKKPCIWNGIEYPSQAEAAKVIGIDKSTMNDYVKRGYTSDIDIKRPRKK